MLQEIRKILKTMGEGLAFADAGEMLTDEQKSEVLSRRKRPSSIVPDAQLPRVVLASDETFSSRVLERAIALSCEKNAMLDLLCVTPEGSNATVSLATVLPRLELETDLDFQITRRCGELLVVAEHYIYSRQDILMILLNVGEGLKKQAASQKYTDRWLRVKECPVVELSGDMFQA